MVVPEIICKNFMIWLAGLQMRALRGCNQNNIETIANHVVERAADDRSQSLVRFARAVVERATNVPNRFTMNGEQTLLDRISPLPIKTVFDVGANVGEWSLHALEKFPRAELHAFEIVPSTFEQLRRRLPRDPRVNLNPFGLSDDIGRVGVNLYSSNLISSMFPLDEEVPVDRIECPVERGADYAAGRAIDRIDLLKIDVEGAEGKVLAGFEPMISQGCIRLIQFEYNRGALLGDFLLKHAYAFFSRFGYRLGKLTPRGVQFHPYHVAYENFAGPNYVACRENDAALIGMIAWK